MINEIKATEIYPEISKLLNELIEENIPYKWVIGKEPFENRFGKTSYDYSGNVAKMTKDDLIHCYNNIIDEDEDYMYMPKLEGFLVQIYINNWTASYVSNCGKTWTCYFDLLKQKYDDWTFNNFDMKDSDGLLDEEKYDKLHPTLDEILSEFLEVTDINMYYHKILKGI